MPERPTHYILTPDSLGMSPKEWARFEADIGLMPENEALDLWWRGVVTGYYPLPESLDGAMGRLSSAWRRFLLTILDKP
jgi:hypothetical protein